LVVVIVSMFESLLP